MPLELGAAFRPRHVEVEEVRAPSIEDLRSEQLLIALGNLQQALNSMPAPVVHVAEPDLTDIVNAVTGLRGPATPEEIAQAVREAIDPSPQPTMEPVLLKLTEALERLDFRMKGIGVSSGGGGVTSRVQNEPNTTLDTQEAALETRYEWQSVGGTSKPLYVGTAAPGLATSSPYWRIQKFTYITGPAGDAVPSVVQTVTGVWNDRASIF